MYFIAAEIHNVVFRAIILFSLAWGAPTSRKTAYGTLGIHIPS
jgi:hypothetical protein